MINTTTILADVFGDPGDFSPAGNLLPAGLLGSVFSIVDGTFSAGLLGADLVLLEDVALARATLDAVVILTSTILNLQDGSDATFVPGSLSTDLVLLEDVALARATLDAVVILTSAVVPNLQDSSDSAFIPGLLGTVSFVDAFVGTPTAVPGTSTVQYWG